MLLSAMVALLLATARAGRSVREMLPRLSKYTCSCPLDDAAQWSSIRVHFERHTVWPSCWMGDRFYSCTAPLPVINCRCHHDKWTPPPGEPIKGVPLGNSQLGFVFAYGLSQGCDGTSCTHTGWTSATRLDTTHRLIEGHVGFLNAEPPFSRSFTTPARHRQEL